MTSSSLLVRFGALPCLCFATFGCGSGAQTGNSGQPSTIGGGMSGSGSTTTGSSSTGSSTTGTANGTTTGSATTGSSTVTGASGEVGGASAGPGGTNGGATNGSGGSGVEDGGTGGEDSICRGRRCTGGASTGGESVGGTSPSGGANGFGGCFSSFANGAADRIALPPCNGGATASGGAGVGGEQAAGGSGAGEPGDGFNACQQNEDCVVVAESCCGTCGAATPDDAAAVNRELANDYRTEVCGPATACVACAGENDPRVSTVCETGRCIVVLALD